MSARRRPLPDHDVELVVLQRRVKDLLQRRLQPMNLVDEQDLLVAEIGQDGGQVALDLQSRPGGLLKGTASSLAMMVARVVLPSPGGP